MMNSNRLHALRSAVFFAVAFAIVVATAPAFAAGNPDFDAVTWMPIDCATPDLISHTSPGSVNFVGDANSPAAYYAFDANYLYFRYRMDGNPTARRLRAVLVDGADAGPTGQSVPVPVPALAQRQGRHDRGLAEHVASDIDFTPLFHDDSEVQLFSQHYAFTSGSTEHDATRRGL